jgi:hypothetical protein
VKDLPLFVPLEAFVVRPGWIAVGHALWLKIGEDGRDYFIPQLSGDLRGFLDGPASSRDLAALGTLVLSELTTPEYKTPKLHSAEDKKVAQAEMFQEVDGWHSGQDELVPSEIASGWTGHSERSTLPSLYAAMNVPKSERDPLGRWCPSGSDDYVRTYKVLMRSLATRLRGMLEQGDTFEVADEGDAMEDVLVFMSTKGREVSSEVHKASEDIMVKAKKFYRQVAEVAGVAAPQVAEPCTVEAVEVEKDEESSLFVIASSKRGTALCLHRREGCWRAVGLVFHQYELYNESPVPACLYKTFCRDCWPREGPQLPEDAGESTESPSSDSSQ